MEKNIDEAVKWLRKAAELGNQEAMLKLGTVLQQSDKSFSKIIEEYQLTIKERDLQILQLQKSIESVRLQADKNAKISYMDGYNDAKAGKRNKYIKEEKKVVSKTTTDSVSSFVNVVGSIIEFGNYPQNAQFRKEPIRWRILAVEGGKALIISLHALECMPYNTKRVSTSWDKCTLRKWLNNDFISSAFSSTEQNIIQLVQVIADKNPKNNTNQGSNTKDKVFILSVKEIEKYFKYQSDRTCKPTLYAVNNGAYKDYYGKCHWWLRTLGVEHNDGSNVATRVGDSGEINLYGGYVDAGFCAVRPALWINLKLVKNISYMK